MRHPLASRACLSAVLATSLLAARAAIGQSPAGPPTRPPDGPGAPKWRVVGARSGEAAPRAAPGQNPPPDEDGAFLIGPDYRRAPELGVKDGVPRGTVQQFQLDSADSRFYPGVGREAFGTVDEDNPRTLVVRTRPAPYKRTITVYVPAQYARGTPAPLLVANDGPALDKIDDTLPRVLDSLIAERRVPALVAVMIQNGGGDAQGSERGLEYDTLSGRFAEFVEAEVLPQVEARYGVTLTRDPDGRAAMGCSSGAAAAFTMAWFHPEWYRRVVSYSGTYVNQQWPFDPRTPGGAWDYHETLVPASPRKPLRIWMHVGDRDLYNPNVMRDGMHDWVEANHRMAAALEARGYSYQYVFALASGHCDRRVIEQTLPEALEYVWRGARPAGR